MSYYTDLNMLLSSASGRYEYNKWKKQAIEKASQNGLCLKYESEWWSLDRDIVMAAIRQNPLSIRYAPRFQSDKTMALIAVRINGLARFWLDADLQEDKDIQYLAERNLPQEEPGFSSGDRIFSATWDRCPPIKYLNSIKNCIYNETPFIKLEKLKGSRFIRDSHVTLFSGKHLLPYSIKNPLLKGRLMAILPPTANHFFINIENEKVETGGAIGKGFEKCNVDQAMITAYDFGIPFKRGKTCIEGGNCYLFISNGEQKAVVGELSIYLSMLALEEQGVFEEIAFDSIIEPSSVAYRIARNLAIYTNTKKPLDEVKRENSLKAKQANQHFDENFLISKEMPVENSLETHTLLNGLEELEKELAYRKLLVASVSVEDRIKYFNEARKIEAQLNLTKIYIANELEVPLQNIAFVPQTKFHIDMEMFVTPKGEIVLHDDQETLDFLDEIQRINKLDKMEEELLVEYRNTARNRARAFKVIQEMRIKIFRTLHIDFHILPAVLEAPAKSALNYCNGILVKKGRRIIALMPDGERCHGVQRKKGFAFITTGPSAEAENVFHKSFIRIFNSVFPKLTLHGVPDMSHFVAKYHGGIHCLTFENSLVFKS